jgi:L-gulono-1,4-lactone dehydrogenase
MANIESGDPRVSIGVARRIENELHALLVNPNEQNAHKAVVDGAFMDSAEFVSTVLSQFDLPEADFVDVRMLTAAQAACGIRQTWSNYVGTQTVQPIEIACPTSIAALREAITRAAAKGLTIRAVGSHHAWSDAALTDGMVLETDRILEPLEKPNPNELRDPLTAATVRWIPGGMTIRAINDHLDAEQLALINMGGYDGQTLAGVISTSTHGSGIKLGSFPSFVEALLVVKADGSLVHIESANGPTNPLKYSGHEDGVPLIQDDDVFQASVVAVGCLGIIVGVLLRVRTRYFLSEVRTLEPWTGLRDRLRDGSIIRQHRHVEVWINPHPLNGDHTCLLTLRDEVPDPGGPTPHKPFRNLYAEFLASRPGADKVLAWLFNSFPAASPRLIESALNRVADASPHTDLSFRMLNIGASNNFAALSAELGVDLAQHVDAVDAMLTVSAAAQGEGTYHSGPIALRYVAPSPGFLSMQPRETCMIELPLLRDVFGGDSMIWRHENVLTKQYAARPHWGQRNFLTGSQDMIRRLYGTNNVDRFLAVFKMFNPKAEFSGRFTDRVGFTSHAPSA